MRLKHPQKTLIPVCLILLLVSAVFFLKSPGSSVDNSQVQRIEFHSRHMGSLFRVIIYSSDKDSARIAADSAFAMANYLNSVFSDYDPDSELSLLSDHAGSGKYVRVSEHMFRLLETAQEISTQSNGAYDITIGPLSRLWRDVIRGKRTTLPNTEELKAARRATGFKHLLLDTESMSVSLTLPGMKLDPGGIAKGYTADRMSEVLASMGFVHTLVDAGGDMVLGSAPPGSAGWEIAILIHDHNARQGHLLLHLENTALTTSGDLFQYYEHGGLRYSHIINPVTGVGLTQRTSVTVLGAEGAIVDAWATALNVLAGDHGLKNLSCNPGYHARIEVLDTTGISIHKTGFFE